MRAVSHIRAPQRDVKWTVLTKSFPKWGSEHYGLEASQDTCGHNCRSYSELHYDIRLRISHIQTKCFRVRCSRKMNTRPLKRGAVKKCSFGCPVMDQALRGGLPTGLIVELTGVRCDSRPVRSSGKPSSMLDRTSFVYFMMAAYVLHVSVAIHTMRSVTIWCERMW